MSPEYDLSESKFDEVTNFLFESGAKPVARSGDIADFNFEGEPVVIITRVKRIFKIERTLHIDKDAREQFEIRTHKRLIDIIEPTNKTIDSLTHLDLPAGVDIELKM